MNRPTRIAALVFALVMLAGCGASGGSDDADKKPTTTVAASDGKTATTTSGGEAPSQATPEDTVAGFLEALEASDAKAACEFADPSWRSNCIDGVADFTVNDAGVGQSVIEGDQALVTITGEMCIDGECHSNDDPSAGLPDDDTDFAEALSVQRNDPQNSPVSPCIKIDGKWYLST